MSNAQFWYVIKQPDQTCSVESFDTEQEKTSEREQWGWFKSEQEAIAKKVGLIRAGKCQPQ
jgi:hypothetical protein